MSQTTDASKPRKQPVQARSVATVATILDGAIQVLQQQGIDRTTTTRVAERAGVSVGSLYQYFPNRETLLTAVLVRYLNSVADRVEEACAACHHQPLDVMAQGFACGWLDAKLLDPGLSRSLYAVAENFADAAEILPAQLRIRHAVEVMLSTASEGPIDNLPLIATMTIGAVYGPVRLMLEGRFDVADRAAFRQQLIALTQAWLREVAQNTRESAGAERDAPLR